MKGKQPQTLATIVSGAGRDYASPELLEVRTAEHATLRVSPPRLDTTFASFQPIKGVLQELVDSCGGENSPLVRQYRQALYYVSPGLVGSSDPRTSPLEAHAVANAVIRRISRETQHAAVQVDAAARFTLEALRNRTVPGEPMTIVVPGLDLLDRPTLRFINRLMWLREPEDHASLQATVSSTWGSIETDVHHRIGPRLGNSRGAVLERLRNDWDAEIEPISYGRSTILKPVPEDASYEIADVAEAVVEHNYDRAYVLAASILDRQVSESVRSDVWRLIAIADANTGDHEGALSALREARITGDLKKEDLAHLDYLTGLLHTKRKYDLEKAEYYFKFGLSRLHSAGQDSNHDFERAWLLNGMGLLHSLRARSASPEQRPGTLHEVLRNEIEAYKLVHGSTPRDVYLRHNLLANAAFVLEMLGEFDQAIVFWTRAFGQYRAVDGGKPTFGIVYDYRVGLLEYRAGRTDRALDLLESSLHESDLSGDRFQAERITYALAYVRAHAGQIATARETYMTGMENAWGLRDPVAMGDHLRGLVSTGARDDWLISQKVEKILARICRHDLTELWRVHSPEPSPPSPKLPAYIPGIDLEPAPDVNLNVYLGNDDRSLALPKVSS